MTLTAANIGGWALNEVLTSTQMNHLQSELLKAVDGAAGGTYNISANLIFGGAGEVRFNNIARILTGADLFVDAGAAATFNGVATFNDDVSITGDYVFSGEGELDGDLFVFSEIAVEPTGVIRIYSGALLDIASGGDLTVSGGGELRIAVGGALAVGINGDINVESGGDINLASGAEITGANGSTIKVDDPEDLLINNGSVGYRMSLAPLAVTETAGVPDWTGDPLGTWLCHTVSGLGGKAVSFPLRLLPGDTLQTVLVSIEGGAGAGHAATPQHPVEVQVIRVNSAGGFTIIDSLIDPTTWPSYDAAHFIALNSIAHLVGIEPIFVVVFGEHGTDSVADTTRINSIEGTVTARGFRGPNEIY